MPRRTSCKRKTYRSRSKSRCCSVKRRRVSRRCCKSRSRSGYRRRSRNTNYRRAMAQYCHNLQNCDADEFKVCRPGSRGRCVSGVRSVPQQFKDAYKSYSGQRNIPYLMATKKVPIEPSRWGPREYPEVPIEPSRWGPREYPPEAAIAPPQFQP